MLGTMRPMILVCSPLRVLAAWLGMNPNSVIALRTLARVLGLTFAPPLMTRETVVVPTSALLATSESVA